MTKPAKAVTETEQVEERTAKQLPIPKGYKILIALPEPEEQTKGGIIKFDQNRNLSSDLKERDPNDLRIIQLIFQNSMKKGNLS